VLEAADAAAALAVLRSPARVDLLLTDIGMPGGINGRQLADSGRELRPGLKILFITGSAERSMIGPQEVEQGMHLLAKPFDLEALTDRIREVMTGHPGTTQ
jgi:CheY-like chemotaxis protein